MSWFKKKEEESHLPELPDLKEFPEPNLPTISNSQIPEIEIETTTLPEIPSRTTQDQIKQAISEPRKDLNLMQKSSFEPLPSIEEEYEKTPEIRPREQRPNKKEIYIKLEKFDATSRYLSEINEKVIEIEKLLLKTKTIKEQEEKELEEWQKQIQSIKSKIDFIDKDFFKIE